MKYSYEQRLVIVTRVKRGEAIAHLSKKYPINETQILAWVRMVRRLRRALEPLFWPPPAGNGPWKWFHASPLAVAYSWKRSQALALAAQMGCALFLIRLFNVSSMNV